MGFIDCESCWKSYNIDSMSFENDPDGILCNSCYDEDKSLPDLGIDVGEDINANEHVG